MPATCSAAVGIILMMSTPVASLHGKRPVQAEGGVVLPEISTMMGGASETLKAINSQTILFETRVAQKQAEVQAKLSKLKTELEQKLAVQEQDNKAVAVVVVNLTEKIHAIEQNTEALEKSTRYLQKGNTQRRGQLQSLEGRLATARAFVENSLNATNDADAQELSIFTTPKPSRKPQGDVLAALGNDKSVEEAMEYMAGGHGLDEGTSLLSLSAHVSTVAVDHTRDLLQVLAASLDDMAKTEEQSEKTLMDAYAAQSKKLSQTYQVLAAKKTAAEHQSETALELQTRWQAANAHLTKQRTQLDQRLQGVKLFMQRLSGTQ